MQEGWENKKIYANYFHQREGAGEYADAGRAGGEKFKRIIFHQREGMWKYADVGSIRLVFHRTLAFIKKNPRHVNFSFSRLSHIRVFLLIQRESQGKYADAERAGEEIFTAPINQQNTACPGKWHPPTYVTY